METIWSLPKIELRDPAGISESRRTAVLTGQRAWQAFGPVLQLPTIVQAEPPNANEGLLDDLASSLPEQAEVVYGVGGGLVADAAKYVAWKNNLPCVLIPTILSVDGFFTSLVAVRRNGSVEYVETGPAESVIIDLEAISNTPRYVRGTGITQILSMTTAILDWQLAKTRQKNTVEERFQLWGAQIAAAIAQQAYKIAEDVGEGEIEALRNLLDLMCVEVQLTNQLGHNRPQEGSEQIIAHAIENRIARDSRVRYADLLGPGILLAAAMHNQNITPIRETLSNAGVRLNQLSRQVVIDVLVDMPTYIKARDLPYTILNEKEFNEETAGELIDQVGLPLKE